MLLHAPARTVFITAILQGKPVTAQALWRLRSLSGHFQLPWLGSKQVAMWSSGLVLFSTRATQKCLHNAFLYRLQGISAQWLEHPFLPTQLFSHTFSSLLSFSHTAEQHFCHLTLFTLRYHHSGCEAQLCPALGLLKLTMFYAGQPGVSSQGLRGRPQPHQVCLVQS